VSDAILLSPKMRLMQPGGCSPAACTWVIDLQWREAGWVGGWRGSVAASALAAWRPPMRLKNMHTREAKINNKKIRAQCETECVPQIASPGAGWTGGGARSACMVVSAAAAANWGSPKGDRLAAQPH
jgi:hypothetical protein